MTNNTIDKNAIAFEEYRKAVDNDDLGYGNKEDFMTGFDAGWERSEKIAIEYLKEEKKKITETTLKHFCHCRCHDISGERCPEIIGMETCGAYQRLKFLIDQ